MTDSADYVDRFTELKDDLAPKVEEVASGWGYPDGPVGGRLSAGQHVERWLLNALEAQDQVNIKLLAEIDELKKGLGKAD